MYTTLRQQRFAESAPLVRFVAQFLNVGTECSDYSVMPTLVEEPDPQCADFSLKNVQVYKDATKCTYSFLKSLEKHFSPVSDALALCNQQEKNQFANLAMPVYSAFKRSNYRVFRAVSAVFAVIFGFPRLYSDVCAGIRQFNTTEYSASDPDSEVRLYALVDKTVPAQQLLMDDNEVVRVFATAEAQNLARNAQLGQLLLGEFRGARIFALCSLLNAQKPFSRIAKLVAGCGYSVLKILAADAVVAAALLYKQQNLFSCDFSSVEEFALFALVLAAVRTGQEVSKSIFCGYKGKYGLSSATRVKELNGALEELYKTSMTGSLQAISARLQTFYHDGSCVRAFNELFYTCMDEFRADTTLRDLTADLLSAEQARDMIQDDDDYLRYLDDQLGALSAKVDESAISKLLTAMPNNFPHCEAILAFFAYLNDRIFSTSGSLDQQCKAIVAFGRLLFYLMLRLKESSQRTSGATEAYCSFVNAATHFLIEELHALLREGITEHDESERIQGNMGKMDSLADLARSHARFVEQSISAFSGLLINELPAFFLAAYCAKYYCFSLADMGHPNEHVIAFQDVQKQVFEILPFSDQVVCCALDTPLLQPQLARIMKQALRQGTLFQQLVGVFNYLPAYQTSCLSEFTKLQKEIAPDANIGSIIAKQVNAFFRGLKTDLKNAKKEWLKIAMWCSAKQQYQAVLEGMDQQDLIRIQQAQTAGYQ